MLFKIDSENFVLKNVLSRSKWIKNIINGIQSDLYLIMNKNIYLIYDFRKFINNTSLIV